MAKLAAPVWALLLYSPSALGWGGLGHEAICKLAFRELDDTARRRVIALIQTVIRFNATRGDREPMGRDYGPWGVSGVPPPPTPGGVIGDSGGPLRGSFHVSI